MLANLDTRFADPDRVRAVTYKFVESIVGADLTSTEGVAQFANRLVFSLRAVSE